MRSAPSPERFDHLQRSYPGALRSTPGGVLMAGITAAQLRELFAQEAEGRLVALGQLLLELEQAGGDEEIVRSIFREFHTLKGSAAVAGLSEVSRIAHNLEELANTLRLGGQPVTPEVIDTLKIGTAQLSSAINPVLGSPAPDSPAHDIGPTPPAVGPTPRSDPAQPTDPQPAAGPPVRLERWEELRRLVTETAATHQRLGRALSEQFNVNPMTLPDFDEQSRLLSDLHDCALRNQLVPVSTITDRLHQVVSDLTRAQAKQVRWQAHGTDTELDRGVLDQLSDSLLHLARNAADHGIEPPDQRIHAGKRAEGSIRLRAVRRDSDVLLSVTDDGRGIDGSAPGMGLDRVRASVEAVHGRVEVQSYPGAGTEFRIIVPVNPPGRERRTSRANGAAGLPTPRTKSAPRHQSILVVDDALTIRELQRAILVRAGFDVRVATDGNDALASLAQAPSDLVLTDLQMPNMGGYALTRAIRADPTLTHIPVLILSSGSTYADRQRGLDAGASGYLDKTAFDEASLLSTVSELLGANA
jgi:chemotaxis protein histidine kinase CheA